MAAVTADPVLILRQRKWPDKISRSSPVPITYW